MSRLRGRLVTRSAAALSLLAVVLATGESAHAASRTVPDATGDVYSALDEQPTPVSGPEGDITSVTTTHGQRFVRIKVRARHLSLQQTMLMAEIRTGARGPRYSFVGMADIGMRMAIISRGQTEIVRCPGIWTAFRPRLGYVTAVIPRSCLGNPRWVRAGAALTTGPSLIDVMNGQDPFGEDAQPGTVDIGGTKGLTSAQTGEMMPRLPLGPRVRVG